MEFSAILSQTRAILGDDAEGSSRFTDTQYANALQWAQEQAAQMLGLTYLELNEAATTDTGPWGETLNVAPIPVDAIKVARCEIGTEPEES